MKSLEQWARWLSKHEMPVLARTAHEVADATEREGCSTGEMARIVLQDSSMTARVLKLANTVFYNPTTQTVRTISRAVIVLGFDAVRSVCLSAALMDTVLRDGRHHDRVVRQMARAFHAAVQARAIAVTGGMRAPEEIYIATLLCHLGEMAFWCFGGQKADALADALDRPGRDPSETEHEILGFHLSELTLALNREWRLTPLLAAAIEGRNDPRATYIRLGIELAEKAELGWGHPEVRDVLERMAEKTDIPINQIETMAHMSAEQAAAVICAYGAPHVSRLIPTIRPMETTEQPESANLDAFLEPDPMLQLQILRDIGALLTEEAPNLSLLFNMVLEGIHRGIGMDRTVLALVTQDRKRLRAKHTLGLGQGDLMQRFDFAIPREEDIFSRVLETRRPEWFRNERGASVQISPVIRAVLGDTPFFVAPLIIQGRAIGLVYADRSPSRRPLDEESFTSFRSFGQQANLGLALLH